MRLCSVLLSLCFVMRMSSSNILEEIQLKKESIMKDHFGGFESVAQGLWFENGGLEIIASKIMKAMKDERKFVVAFGGTSITAGHDNYYNQTYTEEFRRLVGRMFSHAHAPIEIRNIAHGANPHIPYVNCVEEFYGKDADVVSIEMKVMSKARQTGKKKKKDDPTSTTSISNFEPSPPAAMTEMLIRNALMMPNQPAILIADGVYGGPRHKENQPIRTEPPPLHWPEQDSLASVDHVKSADNPKRQSLLEHYKGFGLHRVDVGVATWYVDHLAKFSWETLNGEKVKEEGKRGVCQECPHLCSLTHAHSLAFDLFFYYFAFR
jgi:hypothetical protein